MKVRINDLARELGIRSSAILEALPLVGVTEKKTHSSSLEDWEGEKVRAHFRAHPEKSAIPLGMHPPDSRPKIDLYKISKPGDVMKLLRQREAMAAQVRDDQRSKANTAVPLGPNFNVDPGGTVAARETGASPELSPGPAPTTLGLELPESFSFYSRGFVDFDHVIRYFDWDLKERPLTIDLSTCSRSNFQTLALLVQYAWYLTLNGCTIKFKYGTAQSGSTKMLTSMGALDWREVLVNDGRDFGSNAGRKTYALRRRSDVQSTINYARRAIRNYSIGFPEYLSYIISELLYNATEHGLKTAVVDNCQVLVPAIFQFGLYPQLNRLSFLFSDLGMGIKAHLEQTYPPFPQPPGRNNIRPSSERVWHIS